jgi:hypothetical protein
LEVRNGPLLMVDLLLELLHAAWKDKNDEEK